MEAPPRFYPAAPAKKKTPVVLLIIALVLLFGMTLISMAAAVFLYVNDNSLKDEITSLQGEIASRDAATSKINDKVAALESKLSAMADVELATIKGDIVLLKDITKSTDTHFTISNLDLTFSDYDKSYDYYYGEATVTCNDASRSYVVILKQTLNSGGSANRDKYEYFTVSVGGGSGKFYTTDWAAKGKLVRPNYTYEVVGIVESEKMAK